MVNFTELVPSVGLIIAKSIISTLVVTGRGRSRKESIFTKTQVAFASGSVIDGSLNELGDLRNRDHSNTPMIATIAHIIPNDVVGSTITTEYYVKLFQKNSKISNLYKIALFAYNRGVDLALFGFDDITTINGLGLTCFQWARDTVSSGDVCYLMGYPLGNSQMSIVEGVVRDPTFCFNNFASGVDQIYHSAPATSGNSGSCILDASGRIIGLHGWGLPSYENFTGGPCTKSAFPILSHMIKNITQATPQKYFPRLVLGVNGYIVDDVFRVNNFSNQNNLKNIDGILIQNILPNQTIDLYNRNPLNPIKIDVNDIITDIDNSKVGYSFDAPLNKLFPKTLSQSITITFRKPPYDNTKVYTRTFTQASVSTPQTDVFNLNII